MSHENNSYALYPETLVIGASTACDVLPLPGQNRVWLQYGSGGTLFILGTSITEGSTFASAQRFLVPFTTTPFLIPLSGILKLGSNGATTTCFLLRGRSDGFTSA